VRKKGFKIPIKRGLMNMKLSSRESKLKEITLIKTSKESLGKKTLKLRRSRKILLDLNKQYSQETLKSKDSRIRIRSFKPKSKTKVRGDITKMNKLSRC
jgi:hypothetical protein